jgi:3-methyladenine DNA glycosylase AlkD
MLREMGKQDQQVLVGFLDEHVHQMPRTMLRYAIEKLPENERKSWLSK